MTLFWQEIKKIAHPGILAVLAVLGSLYFYLFPSFQIEYFNNGKQQEALYDLSAAWAQDYGPTLEPEEWDQLREQLAAEIHRFPACLETWRSNHLETLQKILRECEARGDPDIAQIQEDIQKYQAFPALDYAGFLEAWRDYNHTIEKEGYEAAEAKHPNNQYYWGIMDSSNYWTIQALNNLLENHDWVEAHPASRSEKLQEAPAAVQARLQALDAQGRGYLPQSMVQSTMEYSQRLGVWVVLSVVLLLSPTLVRDRLYRMRPLQWSARRGRGILRAQMAAALAAALLLTVCNLIAYAIPFFQNGPLRFRAFSLYNRYSGLTPWFDWSYGGYLLVLVAMELLLGLAAGAVTVFLSQYSGNYVAMLLKAVPLFLALGLCFAPWMLDWAFFLRPLGEQRYLPRGLEFGCMAALLALGAGLCAQALRRQRRRELLS